MAKTLLGNNLNAIRKSRGLTQTQLADGIGSTYVSISNYETGKATPRPETIDALCTFLDCTEQDLLGYSDGYYMRSTGLDAVEAKASNSYAPVLGNIAAGDPREAIEQSCEMHWCPPEYKERYGDDCFFLRVVGDSMDRALPDGCYALIVPAELVSGHIYAVKVNGDDATIKRVKVLDGIVVLEPDSTNPQHRRRIIDSSDPDAPEFRCLGRVAWYDYEICPI